MSLFGHLAGDSPACVYLISVNRTRSFPLNLEVVWHSVNGPKDPTISFAVWRFPPASTKETNRSSSHQRAKTQLDFRRRDRQGAKIMAVSLKTFPTRSNLYRETVYIYAATVAKQQGPIFND